MVADSHGEGAYTKKTAQKHKEYHRSRNRKERSQRQWGGWAGEGEEGLVRVKLGETGRAGKGGWRQARREMAEAWTGGQLPSQAGRAGVSWGPGAG